MRRLAHQQHHDGRHCHHCNDDCPIAAVHSALGFERSGPAGVGTNASFAFATRFSRSFQRFSCSSASSSRAVSSASIDWSCGLGRCSNHSPRSLAACILAKCFSVELCPDSSLSIVSPTAPRKRPFSSGGLPEFRTITRQHFFRASPPQVSGRRHHRPLGSCVRGPPSPAPE